MNELVSRELRQLEKNERYASLQQEIIELQKPLLEKIAVRLKKNLQGFLGAGLRDVTLSLVDRYRFQQFGKTCQITVDDGVPTVLERKGDGVQSLAAISLMIGALQEAGVNKDIIVLLDEPESHLHPKAIHQLREVLDTLRQDSQLIVTTHCPLLVNRANVASNLIVSKSNASPAKSLTALRDVLGVRTSDNLQHAALIIVIEGPDDEVALRALFSYYSKKLSKALSNGSLAFHILGGASKLSSVLALLQSSICNYYIFLDDDNEGRKAYSEAEKLLLASPANTTFTKCMGMKEAEFEDLLQPELYCEHFMSKYSVDVKHKPFNAKEKWSKRICIGLSKAGKSNSEGEAWTQESKYDDKRAIAKLVSANPGAAIHPSREDILATFIASIEIKLESLTVGKAT